MYIERIHISGYGIFSDFSLPDLRIRDGFIRGLNVVIGANESGKTTLLSFIRAILFGMPSAKSREKAYPPLAGGRHGGLITLVDNHGGRYKAERFAGKAGGLLSVTLPDGSDGGMTDLSELLGNSSKDLFRNVFAFSLSELQDFESLAKDEIKSRIYSAGIGTGRLSLHEIETSLKKMRDELFTTDQAISKNVGKLLNDCTQTRQQLRDIASQASKYEELRAELHSLSQRIETERDGLNVARANLSHVEALIQSWETWTDLQAATKKLGSALEIERFPTTGVARLEKVIERLRAAKDNLERAQRELEQQQNKLNKMQIDQALLKHGPQIVELERGLNRYESAKKDLPELKTLLKVAASDLKKDLSDLGAGWDEKRVVDFDTSIPVREAIRSHDLSVATKSQALHDSKLSLEAASKSLAVAKKDLERQEARLRKLPQPSEQDKTSLGKSLKTARKLQADIQTYDSLSREITHLTERHADKSSYKATIERQVLQGAGGIRLSTFVTVILLLMPIVGWLILLYLRRESSRQAENRQVVLNTLGTLEQELQELNDRVGSAKKQSEEMKTSIRTLGKQLQFDDIPSLGDIDSVVTKLQDQSGELTSWLEVKRRVEDAAEHAADADKNYRESQEVVKRCEEDLQQAQESWTQWMNAHSIDIECTPKTALELLSKLESTREKIKTIEANRDRVSGVENAIKTYEDSANRVIESCDRKRQPQSEFPRAVYGLIDFCKKAGKDADLAKQLQELIEEDRTNEDLFRKEVQKVEREVNKLLAEADATDEEQFRRRAEIVKERADLNITIENCTKSLERIAGLGEALSLFLHELQGTTPEKLAEAKRLAEEQLHKDEEAFEQTQKDWGRIHQQVEELEKEKEASTLRLRLNILQENLKVKAGEWSTLTIALLLLKEARNKYERERKPDVVQEGQRFFSTFTGGRYPRLISPPGESQIDVEDRVGLRKSLSQLSRGTAEQLYLALRFGLIQEFSRRSEPLPIIMDDILVNFDPERAEKACGAIGELAEKNNQVILFTCHPDTVELLRAQVPGCRILKLSK